jgi:pimeloyl-ACP methyl ester carboxylesterase
MNIEQPPQPDGIAAQPDRDPVPTSTSALTTGRIVVNGLASPCIQSGDANAETAVIFLHGNPGSSGDFRQLIAACGRQGRAVAFDMPGFGQADKPADFPYNVRGYTAHLDAALAQLGVRRAQLVMHDFGGGWGLAWAAQHPRQIASLTLINTGLLLGYHWHRAARIWQTPLLGELAMALTNRQTFGAALNAGQKNALPPAFVDEMYHNFDQGTRRAVLKLYRAHAGTRGMAGERTEPLRAITAPLLVVWGKRDPYLPVALAKRQAEVFPDIQYAWLDDAAHWPFIDEPAEVGSVLLPFLQANG